MDNGNQGQVSSSEDSSEYQEENSQTLSKHETICLEEVIYHIVSKLCRMSMFQRFKDRARFDFVHSKRQMVVRYNEDTVKKEVKDWILGFDYRKYPDSETNGNVRISDCEWIKDELAKKEFKVFQFHNMCYIAGHKKAEKDFIQAKTIIKAFYYDVLQDNIFNSPQLSRTQQNIFTQLFECASRSIKYQNPNILSLNPQFFGIKRNLLKYVIRSSVRMNINTLPSEVKEGLKKYKVLVLMTTPSSNKKESFQSQLINTKWIIDKKIHLNYLSIVFKRKIDNNTLIQQINKALKFYKCKAIGVRYFRRFTKVKLQYVKSLINDEGNIIENYPQINPYSMTVKFKHIEEQVQAGFAKYLEIVKSKTSTPAGVQVQENYQQPQQPQQPQTQTQTPPPLQQQQQQQQTISNTAKVIKNLQTSSNSITGISTIHHHHPLNNQIEFIFRLSQESQPCSIDPDTSEAKKYFQYRITSSKEFDKKWNEDYTEPEKMIISGYSWENMTMEKVLDKNRYTEFYKMDGNLWKTQQFTVADIKNKGAFKGKNISIKPLFVIKSKELQS